jgi:hypothetical protein
MAWLGYPEVEAWIPEKGRNMVGLNSGCWESPQKTEGLEARTMKNVCVGVCVCIQVFGTRV